MANCPNQYHEAILELAAISPASRLQLMNCTITTATMMHDIAMMYQASACCWRLPTPRKKKRPRSERLGHQRARAE